MSDTPLGYYKWYPRDFYTSLAVRSMSFTARAIYRELLDLQWESERLPDAKRLLSVLGVTLEQFEEFAPFMDELFPDGRNKRLAEMRIEAVEKSEKNRKSGSKGGSAKRTLSKRLPNAKRTSSQTETETETNNKKTKAKNVGDKWPLVAEFFQTEKGVSAWLMFVDHRKQMRKPLTDHAVKLLVGKWSEFSEDEIISAIEESIEKSWIGVFPKEKPAPKKSNEPVLGVDYLLDEETGKRIPIGGNNAA